ncbi:EspA/EspE family type VII secretion system effector [Mycobacterium montefiorense]|uniref:ESX-1 secretion-associated protein EspA/EspE-like domain-containing protein n=1 Tax=Mycobacterium montefiorense TaxID=154654 RepID=A0AA37PLY4_9MYCO|nr:EspA/EspE family type VII secretion system effector [Mycobacterium montefiorense]GBG40942.1 hypothetical protein MmonteBS_53140 [Mycobacterium montefiorense]GKU35146.1 hypothetical protein NJB14191_24920 [Mycobacterium montefiorense]GKU40053.1 hypothetical protein NJB14192_20410 [Mycobacterium montefiorense]GKU47204.1 hypothetical protein NJB14194_38220 [Mycobacterium montefiorense]GKU49447.1 hypothetical protein NJB14195_06940 [Mycobacterium montefiorense]
MSVFTQAARVIASLAGLGQQAAGLGISGTSGMDAEYISGMATSGGADLGSLGVSGFQKYLSYQAKGMSQSQLFARANRMGGSEGIKSFGRSLSIISWTMVTVELLELTIGFGIPTEGEGVKTGSQQFTTLSEQLNAALPDYTWKGSGSDAYAELDAALETMAQAMAALDLQLAALVKDQADWVNHSRLGFGVLKDILLAALIIELAITLLVPAPAGPIAAKAFAIAVATLGLSVAATFIGTLTYFSVTNGQKAEALASKYSDLAVGTTQTGSAAAAKGVAAGETTVSSFGAISDSMSGTSALSVTPTPAPSAGAAKESKDDRAPLSAQAGASGTSVVGAAETSDQTAPDETAPSAPTVTMPTLAQLSGQASKLSSQLSQPTSLVNQAMGQLQQMVQTAQQGQGSAAPAEEAAVDGAARTGDTEGAGAGVGAAAAERAPIGAAPAGTERTPGPNPTGRAL